MSKGARPCAAQALLLAALLGFVAFGGFAVPAGAAGTPQQIHLGWQQKSTTTAMTFYWITDTTSSGSMVHLGTTKALEMGYRTATNSQVPNEGTLFRHQVQVTGLDRGTVYYYRVGDNATGWSPVMDFRTGPGTSGDFTFTVAADMDISPTAASNVARMGDANPAFSLFAGDLKYSNPSYTSQGLWDGWFNQLQPLASRFPFMPSPGNHEYESGSLTSYLGRVALPGNERYYSFNYSNVHFVALESGTSYGNTVDSTQTAWLKADLAAASKDTAHPWIVVELHFPPFSSGGMGSWTLGRSAWSPLFDAYGVDLVLTGHDHNYQRSWPVRADGTVAQRSYTSPTAPVYVVTGGGGASLVGMSAIQPWTAFGTSAFETVRVSVSGDQMKVQAIRPDGSQLDSFTLTRGSSTPPPPPPPSTARLTVKVRYPDGSPVAYGWVEVWDGVPWASGSTRLLATSNSNSTYSLQLATGHTYYAKAWGDSATGYIGQQQVYLTADTTLTFIDSTGGGTSPPPPSGSNSTATPGKATLTVQVRYPDGTAVPWAWIEVWDGLPWAPGSTVLLGTSNQAATYSISLPTNRTYYVKAWGDGGTGYIGQQQVYLTGDTTVKFTDPTKP